MKRITTILTGALGVMTPALAFAEEAAGPTTKDLSVVADTVWVLLCAFLVFFMHAGFALVESGFARKKNVVNILGKNMLVVAMTSVAFFLVGFGFMFGNGNAFIGTTGFLVPNDASLYEALSWTSVPVSVKFIFQMVFAATGATIVSGAVAERIHYKAFIIFAVIMGAFIYPIAGHWVWGGGFLANLGFLDFAGSTVVHSVGGWAALVGVMMLGPRRGKYAKDGSIKPIPGHNMTSAALGTFILWLGWFGFNPGSTMAANPEAIGHIVLTTMMAGASGALVATFYAWFRSGRPDFGLTANGALGGLVGITAPCAFVTGGMSILIGAIAGVLIVEGVMFFDRVRADDPVGATSVHLLCGIFGTLALGLFAEPQVAGTVAGVETAGLFYGGGATQLIAQLIGIGVVGLFTVVASMIAWGILKATMGIRVSEEEEFIGLDISEMGMEAYPDDMGRGTVDGTAHQGATRGAPELAVNKAG